MVRFRQIQQKWSNLFNNYFSTVCKPNEADEPNLPPHTTYLKNPSNTVFKFKQINNATVVSSRSLSIYKLDWKDIGNPL